MDADVQTGSVEDDFKIDVLVPQPRADRETTCEAEANGQRDKSTTEREQFASNQLIGDVADKDAPEAGMQSKDDRVADLAGTVEEELGEQRGQDDGETDRADAVARGVELCRVAEQLEHEPTGEARTADD